MFWKLSIGALIVAALAYANWPSKSDAPPNSVDKIIVYKSKRQLDLIGHGAVLKSYMIALGKSPIGDKTREGDGKTPEGNYTIDYKNPQSGFHNALHISYPNSSQLALAKAGGYDAGGMVMVHGIKNGLGWIGRLHRMFDWTNGCIALTNPEIDEIAQAVTPNASIEIRP